ncbi:cellulose biosynthesis cyclic di-GMP-binding regulatory protein BcsB [Vibrio sp. 99-70-13A1]|uniref:cellulose biosynthesis cyclic di-GMP-binding regulatory protein BcsB n=1 Tax=Vibrio sp. 99-70-13A1 TaxID=2607601 RepID=UPI00149372B3|nr:cellulose biosynthesis cyclic di-GMP-binding regulatory protein BcsB [Vibrio sp. 99-70-13A1]
MRLTSFPILLILFFNLFSGFAMASDAVEIEGPDVEVTTYTFEELNGSRSITVVGNGSQYSLFFGSRLDQIVIGGKLHLDFLPSPAFQNNISQIKVYLNNELMDVIEMQNEDTTRMLSKVVDLDGLFFEDHNELRLQMIGKIVCPDQGSHLEWWELGSSSRIELSVKDISLASELSLLPAPFVDYRDTRDIEIPVVIPAQFGIEELRSAAIVTNYFASHAGWRNVAFPVSRELSEDQHTLVFATNKSKPRFLSHLPKIHQPTVQMVTNPENPNKKMLLVLGKDVEQLAVAASGLISSKQLMSGDFVYIEKVEELKTRTPYDAPNWLTTERPVQLKELLDYREQLNISGPSLYSIDLNFTLPPDLFTWNAASVPLDFQYRYSPPSESANGSRLNVLINNKFIQAYPLQNEQEIAQSSVWFDPLGTKNINKETLGIPGAKTETDNLLSFRFDIARLNEEMCIGNVKPIDLYASIDGDSTIDFTGYSHYKKMPDTQSFAQSGFPYSRMADLSETAVIIGDPTDTAEVQLLLETLGRISANTGLPAHRFTLATEWDFNELQDKDILVMGVGVTSIIEDENSLLTFVKSKENEVAMDSTYNSQNDDLSDEAFTKDYVEPTVSSRITTRGTFASVSMFESPISPMRTVTLLSGRTSMSLQLLGVALEERLDLVKGAVVTLTPYDTNGYNLGSTYHVGELSIVNLIWYHLSRFPFVMAIMAILLVSVLSAMIWRWLNRQARLRMRETHKED